MTDSPLSRRQFFGATAAIAAGTQFHAGTSAADAKPAPLAPEQPPPVGVCQRLGSARFRELTTDFRFSPDSKWLGQITNDGRFTGYEVATGRLSAWRLKGEHIEPPSHWGMTNCGEWAGIWESGAKSIVRRVFLNTGGERKATTVGIAPHNAFTHNGSALIQYDGEYLWRTDLRAGKRVWKRKWKTDASVPASVLEVTDRWVVAVGVKRLHLFDPLTGKDGPQLEDALPKDAPPDNHFQLLNFSADGKRVAGWHVANVPEQVVVWEVETGKVVGRLSPQCDAERSALSADGRHLFTTLSGEQDRLAAIDVRTGRVTRKLAARNVGSFVLSPDGKVLAALYSPAFRGLGGIDGPANEPGGIVRLLNPDTGEPLPQSPDPAVELEHIRFADSHTVVARVMPAFPATRSLLWDVRTNARRVLTPPKESAPLLFGGGGGFGGFGGVVTPLQAALSPDGTRYVFQSNGKLVVADANTGRRLHTLAIRFDVIDHDPFWIGRGRVGLVQPDWLTCWDLADHTFRDVPLKFAADGTIQDYTATPDGRSVVLLHYGVGEELSTPMLTWLDVKTGTLTTRRGEFGSLAVSADGDRVVVTAEVKGEGRGAPADVTVLDRGGWRTAFRVSSHINGAVFGPELSPCGRTAYFAHNKPVDGSDEPCPVVQFWEVVSGELRAEYTTANSADGLGVSPCGRRVATTHRDAPVFLWDVFGETSDPQPKPDKTAWDALGGPADKAFTAVRRLVQHPAAAVELLSAKLKPAEAPKADWVQARINNLGNPDFRTRHQAELDLSAVADVIAEPLQKAFDAGADTQEAHERLERLVQLASGMPASAVRSVRAVEALEYCDVPSAGVLLKKLAGGVESAVLTKEAKGAAKRRG